MLTPEPHGCLIGGVPFLRGFITFGGTPLNNHYRGLFIRGWHYIQIYIQKTWNSSGISDAILNKINSGCFFALWSHGWNPPGWWSFYDLQQCSVLGHPSSWKVSETHCAGSESHYPRIRGGCVGSESSGMNNKSRDVLDDLAFREELQISFKKKHVGKILVVGNLWKKLFVPWNFCDQVGRCFSKRV